LRANFNAVVGQPITLTSGQILTLQTAIQSGGLPPDNSLRLAAGCTVLLLAVFPPRLTADSTYSQVNLVSDVPGLAANTDPNLKNPWGVSFAPTSPFWISNQASNTSTLYDGAGNLVPLVVAIPPSGFPTGPTGQIFNGISSFNLPDGSPAAFLSDTLDGRILGWNGGAAPRRLMFQQLAVPSLLGLQSPAAVARTIFMRPITLDISQFSMRTSAT